MEQDVLPLPKTYLILMIIMTFITLGAYIGFWFLKRKKHFQSINQQHYIPFRWWVVATIYLVISLLLALVGELIFTPYGLVHIESLEFILVYFFLALLYFSIFRVKELLEEFEGLEINKYLLFIFHIFYLQYKINRYLSEVNQERFHEQTA
ncbi:hypothetical protein [Alkalibacillus silvisoli]|uniref:DUF4234 domain-containing protein n=1 Tax=Alkalibacillus silvisoli TaxID=392823 RepID=A0ABN1A243_9BACI